MASPNYWLRRVRSTHRRDRDGSPSSDIEAAYRAVLHDLDDLCDEAAVDRLGGWLVETARTERRLPSPERVRNAARSICNERNVDVPEDAVFA